MGFKCTCASAKDRKKRKRKYKTDDDIHTFVVAQVKILSLFFLFQTVQVLIFVILLWTLPDPSGRDLTKVGSILTVAVGLVSLWSPFSISLRKRPMTSFSVSSDRRMEYRYLSIWRHKNQMSHVNCQDTVTSGQWVAVESITTVLTLKVKHWHLDGMLHHNSLFKFNYLYVSGY